LGLSEGSVVAGLQTEYSFTLPKGYIDGEGNLHRHGSMRLATARDEIEPLRDADINSADDPYLTILVLARVITELGTLSRVTPHDVENFFAADLAFLQDLYGIINFGDPADVEALQRAVVRDEAPESPASSSACGWIRATSSSACRMRSSCDSDPHRWASSPQV
jgi:hypothetical protein